MEFTQFETARVIGARALQLSMGAPMLIKKPGDVFKVTEVAKLELVAGVLPITIKRPRPQKFEVQ